MKRKENDLIFETYIKTIVKEEYINPWEFLRSTLAKAVTDIQQKNIGNINQHITNLTSVLSNSELFFRPQWKKDIGTSGILGLPKHHLETWIKNMISNLKSLSDNPENEQIKNSITSHFSSAINQIEDSEEYTH